jgi:UDP-N-acetylmuramoyl-L-alanyl-D-glutamate--2,6-diaminopimelate ligase
MAQAHGDTSQHRLIADRREAIAWTIAQAKPGDTLLFSGKGHERTLERKQETIPWNELEEIQKFLSNSVSQSVFHE